MIKTKITKTLSYYIKTYIPVQTPAAVFHIFQHKDQRNQVFWIFLKSDEKTPSKLHKSYNKKALTQFPTAQNTIIYRSACLHETKKHHQNYTSHIIRKH